MPRDLHDRIERATGFLFGFYRTDSRWAEENPTWLHIGRPTDNHAFSVVIGRRGFYIARTPRKDQS